MAAANPQRPESACALCGTTDRPVAAYLGICLDCVRTHPDVVREAADEAHAIIRSDFDLPAAPPRAEKGIRCGLCVQDCIIAEGARGYCGLQEVGRIAQFIAAVDPDVLYTLLAFAPQFAMGDLGYTTRKQTQAAEAAARAAGLTRVRIGNRQLLDLGRLFH